MQHTKRGRNQRRRPGGGSNPNRALDSNGPEVRIRGTANQIYDKYIALARDASSSGDRIKAESYLQHAEHYFRIIRATQQTQQNQQSQHSQQSQQNQQSQTQSDGRGEQPAVGAGAGENETASNAQQDESREPSNGGRERAEVKPAADSGQASTDSTESPGESGASEEAEKKPRRRRARRPVKRAENDEITKSSEEAAAAAAE